MSAVSSPGAERLLDRTRAILDRPRLRTREQDRPRDTYTEHRRIVDALRTGDPDLASAAMRVHLINVAQAIERDIQHAQAADTTKKLKQA